MFYGRIHLNTGDVKNDLTISELHHHLRLKTDAYLLHNIYEVLLRAIYHYIHYFFFPERERFSWEEVVGVWIIEGETYMMVC